MAGLSTFWVAHDRGESPEAVQIRVQQMAVIVRRAPLMFLAVAFNAILTAAIGADAQDREIAIAWAGTLSVLSGIGYLQWRTRRRSQTPDYVSDRGPRRLARIAAVQGLLWGGGAAILIPEAPVPEQVIIGLIVAGMGAGGATVLSVVPLAAIGFTVGCVLPVAIRFALIGDAIYLMLTAMNLLFIPVLLVMARSVYISFVDSIRARVANDELLAELSEARMSLLDAIAHSSEGFAQFDEDDRMVVANDRFADFLGIDHERMKPGTAFVDMLRHAALPRRVEEGEVSRTSWIEETMAARSGPGSAQVEEMADGRWVGVYHNRTSRGGMVSTVVDLTAMKQNETELVRAKVEAEAADRAKSEFLALMSHELRTPLNAILGFAELFMDEGFGPLPDPRYRKHASDIHASGAHLLEIINEILDLSKMQAGYFELQESVVDLNEPIRSVVRMLHERADRKHLRLVTDFDPEVPPVVADQRTVKQMVINLVGNAIKFSRTPSDIRISTRLTDSGEVAIAVADRGIGVAAADIPRILQPFGQVESVINRHEQEGTGLGLYLVKQLIELHGGRIEFRSEPGRGSTVTLFLPAGRRVDAAAQ
ncbi:MAG: hypothetical protein TEF_18160 [Rhizobiales bacterium NRL2]|jgi:two-component system cell cycle sensor histidine kinase PleC|nr:MAG: hypothetical protein TEF_18160 [Rhizobiales bacterium NRL2]